MKENLLPICVCVTLNSNLFLHKIIKKKLKIILSDVKDDTSPQHIKHIDPRCKFVKY